MNHHAANARAKLTGVRYPFDVLAFTHLLRSTGLGLAQAHARAYRLGEGRGGPQEYTFASRAEAEAFLEAARALGVLGAVVPD